MLQELWIAGVYGVHRCENNPRGDAEFGEHEGEPARCVVQREREPLFVEQENRFAIARIRATCLFAEPHQLNRFAVPGETVFAAVEQPFLVRPDPAARVAARR